MTRFYEVEVLSVDPHPVPFAPSYFLRPHTGLARLVAGFVKALKSKDDKLKKSEHLEWLQQNAPNADPTLLLQTAAEGFAALTRSVKGNKRLITSVSKQLTDPEALHADLYNSLDDDADLIRPHLFLSYNMCAFLNPDAFSPIHEPEVVLSVRSKYLPEGAIPATNFEFLRGWIVRHLRDHDDKPNPWLDAHSLEELQGHHPKGAGHVFACALEERTKKSAVARFIASKPWVAHLEAGDKFQSAA